MLQEDIVPHPRRLGDSEIIKIISSIFSNELSPFAHKFGKFDKIVKKHRGFKFYIHILMYNEGKDPCLRSRFYNGVISLDGQCLLSVLINNAN